MKLCQRCGANSTRSMMSYFNTQMICGACKDKERAHPEFKAAREAQHKAIRTGDYNFPGVGKPSDL